MEKIAVIGGGAAGMMAAISAAETVMKSIFLRKMRNLERKYLSREKEDAI